MAQHKRYATISIPADTVIRRTKDHAETRTGSMTVRASRLVNAKNEAIAGVWIFTYGAYGYYVAASDVTAATNERFVRYAHGPKRGQ